jgi:hypothetical protein
LSPQQRHQPSLQPLHPPELQATAVEPAPEELRPSLKHALDYVSRRYRVAPEALVPIFETAQSIGREVRLDPLLIIAIIGIESRFNPFAESAVGAQGLMQVMPQFHKDKLPDDAGEEPFLDPVTNIQVGRPCPGRGDPLAWQPDWRPAALWWRTDGPGNRLRKESLCRKEASRKKPCARAARRPESVLGEASLTRPLRETRHQLR